MRYTAPMKTLFNLMLLIVLAGGGYYIYLNVTEDYETLAKIKNAQDQLLVELDYFLEGLKQDGEELKQDIDQKKQSVGL